MVNNDQNDKNEKDNDIYWKVKLSSNEYLEDKTTNGSWKNLAKYISSNNLDIISCEISSKIGLGYIDKNREGYFIGNKVIALINSGQQVHLTGIGYWNKSTKSCHIKWYNSKNMELVNTEARTEEHSGFFLIKNPSKI